MDTGTEIAVLLVDDQPGDLLALENALDHLGLVLVRARTGAEALMHALDRAFAAILMDVDMPGMDGFAAATQIREQDRSRHTPILFLTESPGDESEAWRGKALGSVDFLSKPIVPAIVQSKVKLFVELGRLTAQAELQADRRKSDELARTVSERVRAEAEARRRVEQQVIVSALGQKALAGLDLDALMAEAVARSALNLGVEHGFVMELRPPVGTFGVRSYHGPGSIPERYACNGCGTASLAGFTLLAGEPVVVEDICTDNRFALSPLIRDLGPRSGLAVVIQGEPQPFGVLSVFADEPRPFPKDDVHFVQAVANVVAAAVRRKKDEYDLATARDELAIQLADMTRLHALGARLANSLELPRVLEEVLAAVTGLQGTDRGVLMLQDHGRDAMVTGASVGFDQSQLDAVDAATGEAVQSLISGGLLVEDARPDPDFAPHLAAARLAGCHAMCATPLLTSGGVLIGTIATYFDRPHRPTDRETRMVELYARQAAEFIDNARLYREIREADRHKGEFLAMLAHELRNPLAPLTNALRLLRGDRLDAPETARVREIAEGQVDHLTRLVDDLLDVSRINSGKIQLRKARVDLADAIRRAVDLSRPTIEALRHELTVTVARGPIFLEADSARLEQVFANLLNNAAKYTEPGGRIALEAGRDGDDAFVRVRDSGVGIAPELLPRVFDLFTQAERSLARSQGGLGIGLTLVRRLVELHDGSVSVSSPGIGRGSEFIVRLPLTPVLAEEARTDDGRDLLHESTDFGPLRILVVDDNIDGAVLLARLLELGGHRIALAHDGPSALELALAGPPDVILLDIGLPGMDGYEVARRLRETDDPMPILLVALTGYGQEEDFRRSRDVGFDHHLVKPVDPDALLDLLALHRPLVPQVMKPC